MAEGEIPLIADDEKPILYLKALTITMLEDLFGKFEDYQYDHGENKLPNIQSFLDAYPNFDISDMDNELWEGWARAKLRREIKQRRREQHILGSFDGLGAKKQKVFRSESTYIKDDGTRGPKMKGKKSDLMREARGWCWKPGEERKNSPLGFFNALCPKSIKGLFFGAFNERISSREPSAFSPSFRFGVPTLMSFIAIVLCIGLIKAPVIKLVFCPDDKLYGNAYIQSLGFGKNKFVWSFANFNVTDWEVLEKRLNESFRDHWIPYPNLSFDETLIMFNGRHVDKRHIPRKPASHGFVQYCLVDELYYCYSFTFAHKDDDISNLDRVVSALDTLEDLLEFDYYLYADAAFGGLELLRHCKKKGINCTIASRSNSPSILFANGIHAGLPSSEKGKWICVFAEIQDIFNSEWGGVFVEHPQDDDSFGQSFEYPDSPFSDFKDQFYEHDAADEDGREFVCALSFLDRGKRPFNCLSTIYGDNTAFTQTKRHRVPMVVADYNPNMNNVDKFDDWTTMFKPENRKDKGTAAKALHVLYQIIFNSYVGFLDYNKKKKTDMGFRRFIEILVSEITGKEFK